MSGGLRSGDTIVAIATPPGRGAIGVLRISGPRSTAIAAAMGAGKLKPRYAHRRALYDAEGEAVDDGLVLYFPGPASFTGEDVIELHGHGGPVVMRLLLDAAVTLGARPARPGEFSERAFFNDKLDLTQAEAIADLIDSGTRAAARGAAQSLQGAFSRRIHRLTEGITALRVYVEAAIDFPDEEVDFLSEGDVLLRLDELRRELAAVREAAGQGALLRDGMSVVLAGPPNAGKSSLLNALARREAAIVTEVAGTTRDVLSERLELEGMPLHLVDTAGLRDSGDPIEREGVRRAREEIAAADRVLLVVDAVESTLGREDDGRVAERVAELESRGPDCVTVIRNKIDLVGEAAGSEQVGGVDVVRVSALQGSGIADLVVHLTSLMGYRGAHETAFIARARHLEALTRAGEALERARATLTESAAGELVAEDLRAAHGALGEIVGYMTPDALLGRIFASFCIGK